MNNGDTDCDYFRVTSKHWQEDKQAKDKTAQSSIKEMDFWRG